MLHRGHPGINGIKFLARTYVYLLNRTVPWNYSNRAKLQKLTKGNKNVNKETQLQLSSWSATNRQMEGVHCNLKALLEKNVPYHDGYIFTEDRNFGILLSNHVYNCFSVGTYIRTSLQKRWWVTTAVSLGQLKQFCQRKGIDHRRSPPFFPYSGWLAKNFVDTFKPGILKMENDVSGRIPYELPSNSVSIGGTILFIGRDVYRAAFGYATD